MVYHVTYVQTVLKVRQETLGAEELDTLDAMYDLAIIYQYLQRWPKAKELTTRELDARQRIQGSEHADTLRAKKNLAHIRRIFKKHPSAFTTMAEREGTGEKSHRR
jgi:hypothetical protein